MSAAPPPLPPPVPGDLVRLDGAAGPIALWASAAPVPADATPLLLVHSVNAAASAFEMLPLFRRHATSRPTYAVELPGFGHSDRSARPYLPRLMTDAVREAAEEVRRRHGGALDAMALSLSCEFLARAAVESPSLFRTLGLLSPTGFDRRAPALGPPGSNRGQPWILKSVLAPPLRGPLFRQLTRPGVVRYFLERTWGSKAIDEGLWAYCVQTARQPGAEHAPVYFLGGFLFSADTGRLYPALKQPVFLAHGVRGDFTDYRWAKSFAETPGWRVHQFETGALPHFERPGEVARAYEDFLAAVPGVTNS